MKKGFFKPASKNPTKKKEPEKKVLHSDVGIKITDSDGKEWEVLKVLKALSSSEQEVCVAMLFSFPL